MMGGKTFRNAVHAVAAVALAATAAACGLGSADTGDGPSSPPDAPVVDVAATEQIDLGAYLDLGVTETGLYTVTEDAVVGFDRAGARRWTLRAEGSRPDPDRVEAVPFAPVLLVGWDDAAGLVAYSTDSGEELWRTEDEEWAQGDIADGRVSFADAVTGERRWSVELTSFGCPHADDPLTPVWLREVVLVRCFKNPAPGGRGTDQFAAALDPVDGSTRWERQLTGEQIMVIESANTLTIEHESGETEVLDLATGGLIARRPAAPGSRYRLPRPDGVSLVMDSTTLAENTEMRLEEADGRVRWTAPLDEREELVPITPGVTGNILLATAQQRRGDRPVWLVAYDLGTGARTVIAGPGPSVRGEQPIVTMPVRRQQVAPQVAPWGLLIPGTDGSVAVAPAE